MPPARANQVSGSGQSGAHAIGTAATRSLPRARAVRCAAAATDGQRWGWRRAPLQRTTRCAGCWPRASPQPASSVRCCLARPLWSARTGTACASCMWAHRSSRAPAASPWQGWASRLRSTQRPAARRCAGRCGVIRLEGGGTTFWMSALELPPRSCHRQATSRPELKSSTAKRPSEAGDAWGPHARGHRACGPRADSGPGPCRCRAGLGPWVSSTGPLAGSTRRRLQDAPTSRASETRARNSALCRGESPLCPV